jgi:hypothetical protein
MIINVRGALGAGKSHTVRAVLDRHIMGVIRQKGRRQPVGYISKRLFIPGHYEIWMGGIDTFKTLEEPYKWIRTCAGKGINVVFEGKCQVRDVDALLRLKKFGLTIIHLDVPCKDCIKGVRKRVSATDIKKGNIERSWRKAERDCKELQQAGVQVFRLKREAAIKKIMELLK